MGREGLLVALRAEGLPAALSRTRLLPSRDQCPAESCADASKTCTTELSTALGEVREKLPGLQLDLQELVTSCAKLIPVTFAWKGDLRVSREQAHQH